MNVIVKIKGREAIPVRAIPLLTNWETMSSDYLAKALAGDEHFYHFEGMQAFRLDGGRVTAVPETYWGNVVCTRLAALSDRIKAVEVSHPAGLDEWRSASLKALPAGVFVWRDEFEPRHQARFTHSMSYVKNLEIGEFMGREEQERRTQLCYSPFDFGMADEAIIMEGFEPQVEVPCTTQSAPCKSFTPLSPLFSAYVEMPFAGLSDSLQSYWRREAMVAWDAVTPAQRKDFLSQRDFQNDPSTHVERTAAWLMETMDAEMWWRTESVSPLHAAMLLSRWNPNETTPDDVETASSDEMGPQDFRRLKHAFEGADASVKRTLQNWVEYARQRTLKIHSWIGEWESWVHAKQGETTTRIAPVSAGDTQDAKAPASERRAPAPAPAPAPKFTIKKNALIEQHKHEWPTVARDLTDAKRNGLSAAAKAGEREWREADAMEWARTKGRLQSAEKSVGSLADGMHKMSSLPTRRHTLKG